MEKERSVMKISKRKLAQIATINSGYMSRKGIPHNPGGTHYLLQPRDVDHVTCSFDSDSLKRFNPKITNSDKVLENDDIAFLAKGTSNSAVLIKEPEKQLLASGSFFVLTPDNEKVFPAYLAWYLNQDLAEKYFFRMGTHGTHMPVVSKKTLANLEVHLPELRTQQLIANLSELSTREQQLLSDIKELRTDFINGISMQAIQESERQNNE